MGMSYSGGDEGGCKGFASSENSFFKYFMVAVRFLCKLHQLEAKYLAFEYTLKC